MNSWTNTDYSMNIVMIWMAAVISTAPILLMKSKAFLTAFFDFIHFS